LPFIRPYFRRLYGVFAMVLGDPLAVRTTYLSFNSSSNFIAIDLIKKGQFMVAILLVTN
jgi:hypothetical protein